MKKTVLMLSLMVCFMLVAAVPAFADNMNRTGTYGNNNNGTVGNEIRQDVNRGIANTNRALGTDIDPIDGVNNDRVRGDNFRTNNNRANNFRATAAADGNDFDWGWVGLLGLLGLVGMRNRERDRDRA